MHAKDLNAHAATKALREEISISNFYRYLQWGAIPLLLLPLLSLYGLLTTTFSFQTFVLSCIYFSVTSIAVTAGYHRCFAHRAYSCSILLKIVLLCAGAGMGEGSAVWWVRGHRAHHRYSDTDLDPYGVHEGFFHAHFGWMLFTPRHNPGKVDMTDIRNDKCMQLQHRYYLLAFAFFGFILPVLIAGLGWGDWRGGFFFASCLRMTLAHHATFCVNSVAHYLGDATFDDLRSPRDHFITALITHGEGYHNFHHEFPNDYRNAIKWYQYDPTKIFIYCCSLVGLAGELNCVADQVIKKSALQMQQKVLDRKKRQLSWPDEHLPNLTSLQFDVLKKCSEVVICNGYVHEVKDFIADHPGGAALLRSFLGKDISAQFNGTVYKHSNAANNILDMLRIAKLTVEPEINTGCVDANVHMISVAA